MEKKNKIWIVVVFFIIAVIILAIIYKSFNIKPAININCMPCPEDITTFLENFDNTQNNKVLSSDINGNLKIVEYPTFIESSIMIWCGSVSTIPSGWVLCNGSNINGIRIPDLRGRFVIGAGEGYIDENSKTLTTKIVGQPGGKETHKLKIDEIPSHTHSYTYSDPLGEGSVGGGSYWGPGDEIKNTNDEGGNQAHNNMPPYYVVCYIYYVGTTYNTLLSNDSDGNIKLIKYPVFPIGIVTIWNGNYESIPSGWALCNGYTRNGYVTPYIKGRFPLGVGQGGYDADGIPLTLRNVGDSGGEEKHRLTIEEMPTHNHSFLDKEPTKRTGQYGGNDSEPRYISSRTGNTGGKDSITLPHENMPPFYALSYICYVGGVENNLLTTDLSGNFTLTNYPIFPVGMIMIWGGDKNKIPVEWVICDGTISNGYQTPNLSCRFVICITGPDGDYLKYRDFGDIGGEEVVKLDITEIPEHNHSYNYSSSDGPNPEDKGLYGCGDFESCVGPKPLYGTTGKSGGNSNEKANPHNNMPPYYPLYYICYVGVSSQ